MRKWFYRRWVLPLVLCRSFCSPGAAPLVAPRIRFEFSWLFVFFHGLYLFCCLYFFMVFICFRCGCVSWEFRGVSGRRLHALSSSVLSSILMKWHTALLQCSRKKITVRYLYLILSKAIRFLLPLLLEAFLNCAHQQPCCSLSFCYHPWQLGTKVVSVQSSETILCMPSMILSSKNQNTNHILSMLAGQAVHVPNSKPLTHTCMQTRSACSSLTQHVIRAFFTKDAAMAFFYERRDLRGKDQSKLRCVLEHMSLLRY